MLWMEVPQQMGCPNVLAPSLCPGAEPSLSRALPALLCPPGLRLSPNEAEPRGTVPPLDPKAQTPPELPVARMTCSWSSHNVLVALVELPQRARLAPPPPTASPRVGQRDASSPRAHIFEQDTVGLTPLILASPTGHPVPLGSPHKPGRCRPVTRRVLGEGTAPGRARGSGWGWRAGGGLGAPTPAPGREQGVGRGVCFPLRGRPWSCFLSAFARAPNTPHRLQPARCLPLLPGVSRARSRGRARGGLAPRGAAPGRVRRAGRAGIALGLPGISAEAAGHHHGGCRASPRRLPGIAAVEDAGSPARPHAAIRSRAAKRFGMQRGEVRRPRPEVRGCRCLEPLPPPRRRSAAHGGVRMAAVPRAAP